MADEEEHLLRVLGEVRRRGGIGTQPVAAAVRHAERFVAALPREFATGADLGSGGGLPALVLALRRPGTTWHLIERRATRADLLEYAVRALGLGDRVSVHSEDVAQFAARRVPVDVVTARSFAPLPVTLTAAVSVLVAADATSPACVLVSAAPESTVNAARPLLATLDLADDGVHDGIRRYRRMFHVEPGR